MSDGRINSGKHIDDIIDQTPCAIHNVTIGVACFHICYDSKPGKYGPAICGIRIRKAGFNGKIHPSSLSRGREAKAKTG